MCVMSEPCFSGFCAGMRILCTDRPMMRRDLREMNPRDVKYLMCKQGHLLCLIPNLVTPNDVPICHMTYKSAEEGLQVSFQLLAS